MPDRRITSGREQPLRNQFDLRERFTCASGIILSLCRSPCGKKGIQDKFSGGLRISSYAFSRDTETAGRAWRCYRSIAGGCLGAPYAFGLGCVIRPPFNSGAPVCLQKSVDQRAIEADGERHAVSLPSTFDIVESSVQIPRISADGRARDMSNS
jgi:hypothetical protein